MFTTAVCVSVLVTQSCLTLCNSMGCSLPGSSVHGISQAWILDRVAISFSRESSQPRDQTRISCIAGKFLTAEPQGKTAVARVFVCWLAYASPALILQSVCDAAYEHWCLCSVLLLFHSYSVFQPGFFSVIPISAHPSGEADWSVLLNHLKQWGFHHLLKWSVYELRYSLKFK